VNFGKAADLGTEASGMLVSKSKVELGKAFLMARARQYVYTKRLRSLMPWMNRSIFYLLLFTRYPYQAWAMSRYSLMSEWFCSVLMRMYLSPAHTTSTERTSAGTATDNSGEICSVLVFIVKMNADVGRRQTKATLT